MDPFGIAYRSALAPSLFAHREQIDRIDRACAIERARGSTPEPTPLSAHPKSVARSP